MKIRIRKSSTKRKRKTGFRSRQQTTGGRKTNRRQRSRHGSF
jgi:ribosomal protein L34